MLAIEDFKEVSDNREMISYITNIPDEEIVVFIAPIQSSFINQIKLFEVEH